MKSPFRFASPAFTQPASTAGATTTARERGVVGTVGEVGTPRLVIRGESFGEQSVDGGESYELVLRGSRPALIATPLPKSDGNPYAAITDYLNVSFPCREDHIHWFVTCLRSAMGDAFGEMRERGGGKHGYKRSFAFGSSNALFAIGGQAGTAFLSMPGEACAQVRSWPDMVAMLRDELKARITRWDGAVDDYAGSHDVDLAARWWERNQFNAGGNRPSCNQSGNWIEPDGRGRTFYVGKRENGKMLRVYEKGKQLGDKSSPWVRWELELHNTDRIIPFEVLLEPGRYVAGAYPCMQWVREDVCRVRTTQRQGKIAYERLKHYAKTAYGPLLNVMMEVEGSADAVVAALRRNDVPSRLDLPGLDLKAGGDA